MTKEWGMQDARDEYARRERARANSDRIEAAEDAAIKLVRRLARDGHDFRALAEMINEAGRIVANLNPEFPETSGPIGQGGQHE